MGAQVRFERITPSIGAYAHVDDVLAEGVPQQLLAALETYDVVIIPESGMSDATFSAMAAAMGQQHALNVTAEKDQAEKEGSELYRVSLDKDDQTQLDFVRGNDYWHMDGTVYDTPGKSTMLKCEVPPAEGGDTGFACLDAAWRALPEERKAVLEKLKVRHAFRAVGRVLYDAPTEEQQAAWDSFFPPVEHPLVWHRECGKTSLLIGLTAYDIPGMSPEDGEKLLWELYDWVTQDRFTYRHAWKKGDVVMFNNPGLLHRSFPYTKESGRLMHRTTIAGTEATH